MKDYEVKYLDEDGCHHDQASTAPDVRTAMNNPLELREAAKRFIRCAPKPMFND